MADVQNFIPQPWLVEMLKNLQASEDLHYVTGGARAVFEQAKANWIAANLVNRSGGLALTTFDIPLPERVVFYATSPTTWDQHMVPDPEATFPVLPPAPPIPPSSPISTGAGAQQDQLNQVLGLILSNVIMIKSLLNPK